MMGKQIKLIRYRLGCKFSCNLVNIPKEPLKGLAVFGQIYLDAYSVTSKEDCTISSTGDGHIGVLSILRSPKESLLPVMYC